MRWLVQLVTSPGGTVLDPFAGSGTTAVAVLAAGRNAILIEREAEYVRDIKERIAFYEGGGTHSVQAKHRHRAIDHGPLFDESAV
jgi:site-specific DNA-methyltransferase (adenine-specific)